MANLGIIRTGNLVKLPQGGSIHVCGRGKMEPGPVGDVTHFVPSVPSVLIFQPEDQAITH